MLKKKDVNESILFYDSEVVFLKRKIRYIGYVAAILWDYIILSFWDQYLTKAVQHIICFVFA